MSDKKNIKVKQSFILPQLGGKKSKLRVLVDSYNNYFLARHYQKCILTSLDGVRSRFQKQYDFGFRSAAKIALRIEISLPFLV